MRGCWTTDRHSADGQGRRLVEDLLGDGDLADVVEQRRDRGSGRPRLRAGRGGGPSRRRSRRSARTAGRGSGAAAAMTEVSAAWSRPGGRLPDLHGHGTTDGEIGARGTRASSSGSAKMYVWLRPRDLAEYIAASASRTRVSTRRTEPLPPAIPIEIVTDRSGLPSTVNRWRWTRLRSFSVRTAPSSTSVSVRMSMNSSPP